MARLGNRHGRTDADEGASSKEGFEPEPRARRRPESEPEPEIFKTMAVSMTTMRSRRLLERDGAGGSPELVCQVCATCGEGTRHLVSERHEPNADSVVDVIPFRVLVAGQSLGYADLPVT